MTDSWWKEDAKKRKDFKQTLQPDTHPRHSPRRRKPNRFLVEADFDYGDNLGWNGWRQMTVQKDLEGVVKYVDKLIREKRTIAYIQKFRITDTQTGQITFLTAEGELDGPPQTKDTGDN